MASGGASSALGAVYQSKPAAQDVRYMCIVWVVGFREGGDFNVK